jgi:HD superfamily phosphohydrolase
MVPGMPASNIEDVMLTFQLAGLCHDLGHGVLSHGFDQFLHECDSSLPAHEERSVSLLRHIVAKYSVNLPQQILDVACELIHPQHNLDVVLPMWWYQIIANDQDSIDVDKFDYLKRDATALGLSNMNLDIDRFMEYARICKVHTRNDESTESTSTNLCIAYPHKLQYDINQIFIARHRLHAQVYQHSVVRAIERMLQDVLKCMKTTLLADLCQFDASPERFIKWTDDIFTHTYIQLLEKQNILSKDDAQRACHLLTAIDNRNLYHLLAEVKVPRKDVDTSSVASARASTEDNKKLYSQIQTEYASSLDSKYGKDQWYIDTVQIGYALNPLYHVRFYEKTQDTTELRIAKHIPFQQSSYTFPICSKDRVYRIYAKNKRDLDLHNCIEQASNHV